MSGDELAQRIVDWQTKTFPHQKADGRRLKFIQEFDECVVQGGGATELPDVYITLVGWASEVFGGLDKFFEAVEAKHRVNEARSWDIDPDTGVGQHRA
jgi:hypothetical protein